MDEIEPKMQRLRIETIALIVVDETELKSLRTKTAILQVQGRNRGSNDNWGTKVTISPFINIFITS